ncbi:MAG: oligosaccharide repeat unit polymerase [Candidatus Riflebacteria bacterium]|nr:oligosaccharide repeat unit polymerase [Candidatus Riflebacteria bacterium]
MFIFFSLVILMISVLLYKKASGFLGLKYYNLGMFVFYNMLIFTFFSSIQILYGLEPPGYIPTFSESETLRLFGWLVVMYTMLGIPSGMIFANHIFGINSMKKLVFCYHHKEPVISDNSGFKNTIMFFSVLTFIVFIYSIVSQADKVPFFAFLSGDDTILELMRLRRNSGFKSESYIFQNLVILLTGILPVFCYTSFFYWRKFRTWKNFFWFVFSFFTSIIYSISALVKGPVVYLLLGMVFAFFMASKKKYNLSKLLPIGLLFLFLMGILSVFFQGVEKSGTFGVFDYLIIGVGAFFHRVCFGQLICSYLAFDYFPAIHEHLGFSSTGRAIHDILGLPFSDDYGIIVMSIFRPEQVAAGTAGHATTMFFGEAWANFGYFGILIAPLWVGFVTQIVNIFFLKIEKKPFNMALYIFFLIILPINSSFIGFYYPAWLIQYLLLIGLIYFFYYLFNDKIRFNFKEKNYV